MLDDAHAAPATAGDRLDHHRAMRAERGEKCLGLVQRSRTGGAFDHRHAKALGKALRFSLVAEQIERLGGRSYENDALLRTTPRQQRMLAKKPVARM